MASTAKAVTFANFANDSSDGVNAWVNPTNAAVNDGSFAAVGGGQTDSYWLKATLNAALHVSPDALIVGITAQAEWRAGTTGSILIARLSKGLTLAGTPENSPGHPGGSADSVVNYGGATSLWGTTLIVEDINTIAGFGIAVRSGVFAPLVDYINATIYNQPGNIMMAM